MYDSVAIKPLNDMNLRNKIINGLHKSTLMAFNIRKYLEEDYLQAVWALDDYTCSMTSNFYVNSTDPKEQNRSNEKLGNLLLAVGVPEEVVIRGGFSDYNSLLNKRAYVFVKSFKNNAGEQITYVEKYAPLDKDSSKTTPRASEGMINDEVPF